MKILVVAEHDGIAIRSTSLSCFTFARQVAQETDGEVNWLVLGHQLEEVADQAANLAPVLALESPLLEHPLADSYGKAIAAVAKEREFDLICAASSSFSRDILPRATALLGGALASDCVKFEWTREGLLFECPQFAGAVTATLRLVRRPQFVTVRASSYAAAVSDDRPRYAIQKIECAAERITSRCHHRGIKSTKSGRPDVIGARVVVSGGRAIRSGGDFERLVGKLADLLAGATGSSRALVDAGITSNQMLVGQTGKIVAPDLYVALGISGAVQHLAGMRNARTIVAINKDPDAPIFDIADFGLVGDVYELVPELIKQLERRAVSIAN